MAFELPFRYALLPLKSCKLRRLTGENLNKSQSPLEPIGFAAACDAPHKTRGAFCMPENQQARKAGRDHIIKRREGTIWSD